MTEAAPLTVAVTPDGGFNVGFTDGSAPAIASSLVPTATTIFDVPRGDAPAGVIGVTV
jgi:hypothetical protein